MASPELPPARTQGGGDSGAPQHTLYHTLACLNGEVNGLGIGEVRERLERLGLTKRYELPAEGRCNLGMWPQNLELYAAADYVSA